MLPIIKVLLIKFYWIIAMRMHMAAIAFVPGQEFSDSDRDCKAKIVIISLFISKVCRVVDR